MIIIMCTLKKVNTFPTLLAAISDADTSTPTLLLSHSLITSLLSPLELGIMPPDLSAKPHLNGLVTFASFAVAGLIPLIAYVIGVAFNPTEDILFAVACVMTAITLFILGALTVLLFTSSNSLLVSIRC